MLFVVERLAQLLHTVELEVVLNGRQGHGAGIALWHLKRYVGGVKIARVIAESSTKAVYTSSWVRPYDLGEDSSADFIASPVILGE